MRRERRKLSRRHPPAAWSLRRRDSIRRPHVPPRSTAVRSQRPFFPFRKRRLSFFYPSVLMLSGLVGMIHAKMLRDQLFGDFGRVTRKDAAAGIENDGLVGNFERELQVLFDQKNGLAFFL